MGKRNRQLKTKIEKLGTKRTKKFWIISSLTLTLVFSIACLLLVSYSNSFPSFLPRSWVNAVDALVTYLPGVPLTGKQVITRSLLENRGLKSYSLVATLKLEDTAGVLADLKVLGNVDSLQGSDNSLIKTSGIVAFPDKDQVEVEARVFGESLYLFVTKIPSLPGFNLNAIAGDIQKFLGRGGQELFLSSGRVEKLSTVEEGGRTYYKVDLLGVDKVLGELVDPSGTVKVKATTTSLFVEKNSFSLTKLTLKDPLEFTLLTGVSPEGSPGLNQLLVGETGENFLTVERLAKTFLLLPKAF
jgi:hypothetical protein